MGGDGPGPALDNIIRKAARNRHLRRHGFLQDTPVNSPAPISKKDGQGHERDTDNVNDEHIQPPTKRQKSTDMEVSYDLVQIDGVVQVQIEEPVLARQPSPVHGDARSEDMDIVDESTDADNALRQSQPQPVPIPVRRLYSDGLKDILRRSEDLIRNTARHDALRGDARNETSRDNTSRTDTLRGDALNETSRDNTSRTDTLRGDARNDASRNNAARTDTLRNDTSFHDALCNDVSCNDALTRDQSQTTHRSADQHIDQITDQLHDQIQHRDEHPVPGRTLSPANSITSVIKDTHVPDQSPREEAEPTIQPHPSEQHMRWQSCTFAEWIQDGEVLIRRFEDVTRRAQNLMRTKMELFADLRRTIHAQVERLDEQKRQLDERIDQVKVWGDQML